MTITQFASQTIDTDTSAITISAGRLRQLITAVLPHADTESDYTGLLLEARQGDRHLYAVATDGITMGIARHTLDAPADRDLRIVTDAGDGEILVRLLEENCDSTITLIPLDGEEKEVAVCADDQLLSLQTEGRFAAWRATIAKTTSAPRDHTGFFAVDPHLLERLTPACDLTGAPAEILYGSPTQGLIIRVGDWFLALVMPRIVNGSAQGIVDFAADLAGLDQDPAYEPCVPESELAASRRRVEELEEQISRMEEDGCYDPEEVRQEAVQDTSRVIGEMLAHARGEDHR